MPNIKVRGLNEPIRISFDHGKQLESVLQDTSVPRDKLLKIGELLVRKSEIIAIIPDSNVMDEEDKYFYPRDREIIDEFERDFNTFVKENPDKYFKKDDGLRVGFKEHLMEELGLVKLGPREDIGSYSIIDIDGWRNFQRKWSALQDKRIQKAEKEPDPIDKNEIMEGMAF